MRGSTEYNEIDETFPQFADTAKGFHSVLYKRFYEDRDVDEPDWCAEPGEYWTSARLYLQGLDELEEPDQLVLDYLSATSAFKGEGNKMGFRIDDDENDFRKAYELRDLLGVDDMDDHLSYNGNEAWFEDLNTPADTALAISRAIDKDKTVYVTPGFADILDNASEGDSKYDLNMQHTSGQKFYTDILNNTEVLNGSDSHGLGGFVESVSELDGDTGVIALSKSCHQEVNGIDEDLFDAYPPRIAAGLLE